LAGDDDDEEEDGLPPDSSPVLSDGQVEGLLEGIADFRGDANNVDDDAEFLDFIEGLERVNVESV
jgi:hypothetical protein